MPLERLPIDRLRDKTTYENLWMYVLRLLKERPMYAYEIQSEIKKRFGWEPAIITAYVVLYRLEGKGYVMSEWQNGEILPRKYYRITPKGEELLLKAKEYLESLIRTLFGYG